MEMERGSSKLLREKMSSGRSVDENHISQLLDLIDVEELKIDSWWWKGQPHPDLVTGAFVIPKDRVGDIFGKFFERDIPIEVVGFPLGIIAVDRVAVNFKLGQG